MGRDFESIRRAIESILRKSADRGCPRCATKDEWGGGSAVTALPVIDHETYNGNPPDPSEEMEVVMLVPIHCTVCGLTEFYDLATLKKIQDAEH